MQTISDGLIRKVERSARLLSAQEDRRQPVTGQWGRQELLGHLIDSASNNHQRFVRALLQDELVWPGYDQEGCVEVQRYAEYSWNSLIEFWAAYNRLLAHIIRSIPEAKRGVICRIGDNPPMTLEALVIDYIRHMDHHLEQLLKSDRGETSSVA